MQKHEKLSKHETTNNNFHSLINQSFTYLFSNFIFEFAFLTENTIIYYCGEAEFTPPRSRYTSTMNHHPRCLHFTPNFCPGHVTSPRTHRSVHAGTAPTPRKLFPKISPRRRQIEAGEFENTSARSVIPTSRPGPPSRAYQSAQNNKRNSFSCGHCCSIGRRVRTLLMVDFFI